MPPSPLAAPLDLPCGVRLANRIGKSAMTEALAGPDDAPNVAHDTLYARWSRGGMAVQLTGNVMIDRRYLERPGNVVVEDRREQADRSGRLELVENRRTWLTLELEDEEGYLGKLRFPMDKKNQLSRLLSRVYR